MILTVLNGFRGRPFDEGTLCAQVSRLTTRHPIER